MPKPFYISTAIPYVNAAPHIGHVLEYVQADARARYERLLGREVFYLSGTDENALKNVQAAEKTGVPVAEFVAEHAAEFFGLKDALNLTWSDFIRTTDPKHIAGAQKLWQLCNERGDIYKKQYQGLYCVGCEAFYTRDELVNGLCPEHKKAPELVEEDNYFFRLSAYQKQLREIILQNEVRLVPLERKNEMLAFIDRGLEDFSISRSVARAHGWGVAVPNDPMQIMYVWFDALANYITALNYAGDQKLFKKYWVQGKDRTVVHVIGKGIARFHAIYWLAMLLSAGVPLPTEEFIHGYITVNGEKISKSLGNVIDPYELIEKYGADAVRYYLLGALLPWQDGDFSDEKFEAYYTAHLSNGVGNLASRILTMLEKYAEGQIPAPAEDRFGVASFWTQYQECFVNYRFDDAVVRIQHLMTACDDTISTETPWAKAKAGADISPLLYQLAETLRHIALALLPIIPASAEEILSRLGITIGTLSTFDQEKNWGGLPKGAIIKKGEPLFRRLAK